MYRIIAGFASCCFLMACGSSKVTDPPPPVTTGTISFALQNCASFTTADYVADSVILGTEQIVQGGTSKSYTVPSGKRSAKAVLRSAVSTVGTWTYNDLVTVPVDGSVVAHPHC